MYVLTLYFSYCDGSELTSGKACKQHLPADTLIKVDPVHSSILDRRQNTIRKLALFAILISFSQKCNLRLIKDGRINQLCQQI